MRHEDLLTRDHTTLVVIDVQERLMPVIVEPDRMVANCIRLVKAAQALGVPVIATEQNTKAFGRTVPPLAEALGKEAAPIEKMIFSACGVDSFRELLEKSGRRELLVCGIMTNVCVAQTALDAVAGGYAVHVAADAVTAGTAEDHRIGTGAALHLLQDRFHHSLLPPLSSIDHIGCIHP
ncbi:MAG: isochorismatase family protein [Planctomycetes bacterium]|nr:isochorismatase family protein [Planctomycetota bacterium]